MTSSKVSFLALLCLVGGLVASGLVCTTCAASGSDDLARAQTAVRDKNYNLAVALCTQIIQSNSNSAAAYFLRAWCHNRQRMFTNALTDLNHAILLQPSRGSLFWLRANVYLDLTNYEMAVNDYNRAILLDSNNIEAYIGKARAHYLNTDYEASITDCDEALLVDPTVPAIFFQRGEAYRKEGKLPTALADFDASIHLEPTNSAMYCARATVLAAIGNVTGAIANCDRAIKLDPQNAPAYSDRGELFFELGDYGNGIKDCRKAVELDSKSAAACNNLAWLLSVTPDPKFRDGVEALKYAKMACAMTRWENPDCIGTLAAAYAEVGDFRNAVKWQKQCIQRFSGPEQLEREKLLTLYEQGKAYRQKPKRDR